MKTLKLLKDMFNAVLLAILIMLLYCEVILTMWCVEKLNIDLSLRGIPPDLTYVYRGCRPDEDPSKGLWAKDPSAFYSLNAHIIRGSKLKTQYISTSLDYEVAVRYGDPNHVVLIDVRKAATAGCPVIDLHDGRGLSPGIVHNYAAKDKEVLFEGHIPPWAITRVPGDFMPIGLSTHSE